MKKNMLLSICLLLHVMLFAQNQRPVKADIQKATVYLQGAHLYYSEHVNLVKGNNDIIFENISPFIHPASLQAVSKNGVVMEVKHLVKYKEKPKSTRKYDREIAQVVDSLAELAFDEREVANKQTVLATEKKMLLNNRLMKGESPRDSLPLLRDAMSFLKEKLSSIYDQELKLDRIKKKQDKLRTKLNERHQALLLLQSGEDGEDGEDAQPVHQVIVSVFSENASSTQISFNYFISEAGWVPFYDMHASSSTNGLQLKYFADVTQHSGLDWKNAGLTLSTSNPGENNLKPELPPWYLSFMEYKKRELIGYELSNKAITLEIPAAIGNGKMRANAADVQAEESKALTDYVAVSENIIRTEYEIKLNYTINSDNQPHKVFISQKDVPMHMQFSAVPKICTDAFLLADITGWEDMNIIPGQARVYFDGTYVGETMLNNSSTNDTLSIDLGRDKGIAITRRKIKDQFKVRFIDNEKIETRSIELTVRNTKNIPIDLTLEDQIPVAIGTNDIKIELVDADGAVLDEPTGALKWKRRLGSKESKKFVFTYEVRYPKGRPIAGL